MIHVSFLFDTELFTGRRKNREVQRLAVRERNQEQLQLRVELCLFLGAAFGLHFVRQHSTVIRD